MERGKKHCGTLLTISLHRLFWPGAPFANAQSTMLYLYPKNGYDLCVDSSEAGPGSLADVIIGALS